MSAQKNPAERHVEELERRVALGGLAALDVGCGGGAFVRQLIARGANAIGMDIDETQLSRARASGMDDSLLRVGRAESLPFPDASFDLVCCLFSFHHIPAQVHAEAFAQALRVLRPQGYVYVVEPTPHGAMSEVVKPIEDETEVRTRSHAFLAGFRAPGVKKLAQNAYETARSFRHVDEVFAMTLDVDPQRAPRAADPSVRREVAARFDRHAQLLDGAFVLTQPCVAYLFGKED